MKPIEKGKMKMENENTLHRDNGFLYTYKQIPANKICADMSYNRPISRKAVENIIMNFDTNLVNPCKVSFRDGKYWIFDGNHTLTTLVEMAGGNDNIFIDSKVYTGMTREDEARMFALQNGFSRNVPSSNKVRALFVANDEEVVRFKNVTEECGAKCSFKSTSDPFHIKCYDTAFKIFTRNGENHYRKIIKTIIEAWKGHPDSLRKEIICGLDILFMKFPDLDRTMLVKKLSFESPVEIISKAKSRVAYSNNKKYAVEIAAIYNKRLPEAKRLNVGDI